MSIHKTIMEFLDNLFIYTTSPVLEITFFFKLGGHSS